MSAAAGYPPIGEYGLIGDTGTAALISREGAVEWFCLPDFHSPSVFAAILDRLNGGSLRTRPAGEARISREYLDGAPILRTRFRTDSGVVTLTDFMPVLDQSLAGLEPERQILRIVDVEEGSVDLDLHVEPMPDYGQTPSARRHADDLGWTFSSGNKAFLLRTDLELAPDHGSRLSGRTVLRAGARRYLSFSYTGHDIGILPALEGETEAKLDATRRWWGDWRRRVAYDGPYRDAVLRSAMALRLLTCSQSGAVIAAPTCSLPEAIGGTRNWDYRYCWPRDAAYILNALSGLGLVDEADDFFAWLLHATRMTRPKLAPVYDIYGRTGLGERRLRQFEGYRGSGPVRIGNAAALQLQLDAYGSVIGAVYRHARHGGTVDRHEAQIVRAFGRTVCDLWRRPDDGIWEFRGPRMHTTYSKAICWAALDRLLELAAEGRLDVPEALYRAEAGALRETILRDGWNERRQAFTGALGHDFLDAALLTMPSLGIIDAGDPRMRMTYDRIVDELGSGPLIHRYPHGIDGFEKPEGAFGICCFWAVEYLALSGDTDAARDRFEALLGYASDLGLYAEEIDPDTGAALGNFPQALTHVGLINAALAIERTERGMRSGVAA